MKKIILLLIVSISAFASDYILLSGFAWHSDKENIFGREFDKVIEGVGYQHKFKYASTSVLFYNDSNGNKNITSTVGYTYEIVDNISIGIEAGIAYQTVIYTTHEEKEFNFTAFPKLEILHDDAMVNLIYVPEINYNGLNTPSVLYINFGIKI